MLNAFANLLYLKLCRHNWRKPIQQQAISQNHDILAAGHLGPKRTLDRLCQVAY